MRPHVREFVKQVREARWPVVRASGAVLDHAAGLVVHEIGSLQVGKDPVLRDFFPNTRYIGIDMREGPNVDKVLDVEDYDETALLPQPDLILCCETLEHVERPWKAVKRMQQALGPDGLLVVTVPFIFGIHGHPHDYWRITPQALESLFDRAGFTDWAVEQDPPVPDVHPHTVVGVASNGSIPPAVERVVRSGSWHTHKRNVISVPCDVPSLGIAFDNEEELKDFEREFPAWWEAKKALLKRLGEIGEGK